MRKGENVYQRKDGRWEARYIKGRGPTGKAQFGYCYGVSREEALEKARSSQNSNGHRLFASFLDPWLEERSGHVRASTWESYRFVVDKYIKPKLGSKYLDELDGEALERFKQELLSGENLSVSRVRAILIILRSALKYAKQDGQRTSEMDRLSCPNAPRQAIRVLTEDEQLRLTTCLQLGMDECKFGILLALSTGLRVGELCALRWKDISIRDRMVQVSSTMQRLRQTDGRTRVIVTEPRSAASARRVPLTERAARLCRQMCPKDKEAYIMTGTKRYMEPRTAQCRLKKYTTLCNLEDVSFKTLRDTFAYRCVEAGLAPGTLCEILGIRSIPGSLLDTSMAHMRSGVKCLEKAGI